MTQEVVEVIRGSWRDRTSKPEDLQVGLFGPLIGKFHHLAQRPPNFTFVNSLNDIFLALQDSKDPLLETHENYMFDASRPQPLFDTDSLLALITDLRNKFPQAGDREVSSHELSLFCYLSLYVMSVSAGLTSVLQ